MNLANKHRGEAEVEISGKIYRLKLTMNDLCLLEKNFNKPFGEIFTSVGIREIRGILYLGLRHSLRKITEKEVGDMMDFQELAAYGKAVAELVQSFTGTGEKEADIVGNESTTKADPTTDELLGSIGLGSSNSPSAAV